MSSERKGESILPYRYNLPPEAEGCCDYLFIGHGWDISRLVDTSNIPEDISLEVVALSPFRTLYDDEECSRQRRKDTERLTRARFIKNLRKISIEKDNDFVVYHVKRGSVLPDMLLTTLEKRPGENNMLLYQPKKNKPYKIIPSEDVISLGELVNMAIENLMRKRRKHTSILIYTCRPSMWAGQEEQRKLLLQGGNFMDESLLLGRVRRLERQLDLPESKTYEWIPRDRTERYRGYLASTGTIPKRRSRASEGINRRRVDPRLLTILVSQGLITQAEADRRLAASSQTSVLSV